MDVLHPFRKHELWFGTNFDLSALNETSFSGQNPAFVFVGLNTLFRSGPLDNNGYADLMWVIHMSLNSRRTELLQLQGQLFGLYTEDKYRVTERMTVMGGLRWDPYFPFVPKATR